MAKYHINTAGKAAVCKAVARPCPLGGQHFNSIEDAQHVATERQAVLDNYDPNFPRFTPEFAEQQAHIYAEQDLWNNSFKKYEEDYVAGFKEGIEANDLNATYENVNMHDMKEPEFREHARKSGRARAAWILKAKEEDFIVKSAAVYGKDAEGHPFADKRFLHNPLKKGQTIVLPKGTRFTSTNPSEKKGVRGRAGKIKVQWTNPGYTDGSVGKMFVRPATLTFAGKGGYWTDVVVTPELLRANNLPIFEQPSKGIVPLRKGEH